MNSTSSISWVSAPGWGASLKPRLPEECEQRVYRLRRRLARVAHLMPDAYHRPVRTRLQHLDVVAVSVAEDLVRHRLFPLRHQLSPLLDDRHPEGPLEILTAKSPSTARSGTHAS